MVVSGGSEQGMVGNAAAGRTIRDFCGVRMGSWGEGSGSQTGGQGWQKRVGSRWLLLSISLCLWPSRGPRTLTLCRLVAVYSPPTCPAPSNCKPPLPEDDNHHYFSTYCSPITACFLAAPW